MKVLQCRNVAEALPIGLDYLLREGRREASRAGEVLVAPGPVTTVYERPWERVLFSAVRDANPAFHICEALWMLSGRDDGAFLDNYVRDFSARFAEPDGRIHDAYGRRWRSAFGLDQLDHIVDYLRDNPGDRQCCLQMWDCRAYHPDFNYCDDLRADTKTKPCNVMATFRVQHTTLPRRLDMAVFCRSNDIVLGAYGANAVHFSVMMEYVAARVGVEVGVYHQISFNYHAYMAEIERLVGRTGFSLEKLDEMQRLTHAIRPPGVQEIRGLPLALMDNRYAISSNTMTTALVDNPETFDEELGHLMKLLDILHESDAGEIGRGILGYGFENKFLGRTVWPMALAMRLHRLKNGPGAREKAGEIGAADWRLAMTEWLQRRS